MKKFRVWDKQENKYWKANGINWLNITPDGEIVTGSDCGEVDEPDQDRWIIEQSTGLLDCNGVEVFDGDIVKLNYNEPKIVAVEYDNQMGQWHGRSIDATYLHLSSQEIREVIGNIHEGKHEN
jgi:uncharacterized phage protein (TIGR01671 family)